MPQCCSKSKQSKILCASSWICRRVHGPIYRIEFVLYDSYPGVCDWMNTRKTSGFKFRHQRMSKNLASVLVFIRQNDNRMRQIVSCRYTIEIIDIYYFYEIYPAFSWEILTMFLIEPILLTRTHRAYFHYPVLGKIHPTTWSYDIAWTSDSCVLWSGKSFFPNGDIPHQVPGIILMFTKINLVDLLLG